MKTKKGQLKTTDTVPGSGAGSVTAIKHAYGRESFTQLKGQESKGMRAKWRRWRSLSMGLITNTNGEHTREDQQTENTVLINSHEESGTAIIL